MKVINKILFLGLACLILITPLSLTVSAELYDETQPRVVDNADLLTDSEEEALESQIKTLIDKYDFDIVIVTANTIDGKTPMEYADDYYDYEGYGAGVERDGVLLLISMEDRDWWISTRGYGITVFTDYGIQKAGKSIVNYLGKEQYRRAFESFLSITEDYINSAKGGKAIDTNNEYLTTSDLIKNIGIYALGSFGIGLIAAIITVLAFKAQLKSVKFQGGAAHYEVAGSLNLTRSNDVFLYKNVSRRRREESSGGGHSGGGSSTHTSSSGATHGGGGGKF